MHTENNTAVKLIQSIKVANENEMTFNVDGEICKYYDLVWIILKNRTHRPSTTTVVKYYAYCAGLTTDDVNAFEAVLGKHLTDDARQLLIEPVSAMGAVVVDGEFMHRGEFRDFNSAVFVVQNKLPNLAETGFGSSVYKLDQTPEHEEVPEELSVSLNPEVAKESE